MPRLWPVVAGCTAVATLSLVLPSTLTYDSWSWLTWGREITRLDLDTSGFVAAWKPLPVLVGAFLSFAGSLAPSLWLVVARAGGLLAVALAYRLAHRKGGFAAGGAAAVAMLSSAGFTGYLLPLGMSEPLLAGLALAAVERHLGGRHLHGFLLVYGAALLRPEVWPFLLVSALWAWPVEARRRVLLFVLVGVLPVLWFVPDLVASGDAFRSLRRAAVATQGGALLGAHPGLTVLGDAARYLPVPFGLAALAAVRWRAIRRRPDDPLTLVVLSMTVAWLVIEVALTELGRSAGDQRYLIVFGAGASVLAGIGWGRILGVLGHLVGRLPWPWVAAPAARVVPALLLVLATAPAVVGTARRLPATAREISFQEALDAALPDAVRAVGGRRNVEACGSVYGGFYQAPLLAWHLQLHLGAIRTTTEPAGVEQLRDGAAGRGAAPLQQYATAVPVAPGTAFASRVTRSGPPPPPLPAASAGFGEAIHAGPWRVASTCRSAEDHG